MTCCRPRAAARPTPRAVGTGPGAVPRSPAVTTVLSGHGSRPGRASCPVSGVGVPRSEQVETAAPPRSPCGALMSLAAGTPPQPAFPRWVLRPGAEPAPASGWVGPGAVFSDCYPSLPPSRGRSCLLPSGSEFAFRITFSSSPSHTGEASPLPQCPCGLCRVAAKNPGVGAFCASGGAHHLAGLRAW